MPTVTLIDCTGQGHWDHLHAARLLVYTKNTRLTQGAATRSEIAKWPEDKLLQELDYISKTIRSSWEMIDYVFEIQGVTRAFTHQLVRTRTASYAQQAQRVVDMGAFETRLPATVTAAGYAASWDHLMSHVSETYKLLQENGVPNQDCRGVLPTNVLTNIIAKMDLRTFADLVGKRENLRAQDEYAEVVKLMKAAVLHTHPWAAPFLNPERTKTPALDALLARNLGTDSPVDHPEINAALKELDALKGTWG